MLVVITYDVNITQGSGAKRLRKISKLCERYGVRVQNSVFEVLVDSAQMAMLKSEIESVIDPQRDSVRFYRLGNSYKQKIGMIGKSRPIESGEPMLL